MTRALEEDMGEHEHHDRRFSGGADRLRTTERIDMMELPRVAALCREGIVVRDALDAGTGTGLFAQTFAELGIAVTGIDVNAELLTLARGLVPAVRFIEAAAENLPFPDKSFDLAFLGLVLHETDDPLAALKELRRVSRLRVAIVEWPYREGPPGPPLEHRLKTEAIVELAAQAGYARVETIHLGGVDFFRLAI
jgi:ubiquinone/menaquinone biosynthesis C-methylase UbiE